MTLPWVSHNSFGPNTKAAPNRVMLVDVTFNGPGMFRSSEVPFAVTVAQNGPVTMS
ncbi:MAG: hypothetical protein QOH53_743, partial [Ilumatobacteraceae bacterium]